MDGFVRRPPTPGASLKPDFTSIESISHQVADTSIIVDSRRKMSMAVASDAPADLYTIAWKALLVIAVLYFAVGLMLRWRTRRLVRVTRYEPPQGISPAAAAFLNDGGRYERPFAAALASLAAKGYLHILQTPIWVTLEKLKAADSRLPPEESIVLSSLFPNDEINTYSFGSRDSDRLFAAYRFFRTTLSEIMTEELVSSHGLIWTSGLAFSLVVLT